MERLLIVPSVEFQPKGSLSKLLTQANNSNRNSATLIDGNNNNNNGNNNGSGDKKVGASIVRVSISPNQEFVAVADAEHMLHIVEFATKDKVTNEMVTKTPKVLTTFKEHAKTCATMAQNNSNHSNNTSGNNSNVDSAPLLLEGLDPLDSANNPDTSSPTKSYTGITSLCWSQSNVKLFCGDSTGHVYEFENSAERRKKTSLFISSRPNRVLREEGPIVQINISDNLLLVSSTKRAVVVNLKEQKYCGIGSKPRDGAYGACFLSTPDRKKKNDSSSVPSSSSTNNNEPLVQYIFAARPSRRLWCVDISTYKVLSTLKYPAMTNDSNLKFELLSAFGPYIVSWNTNNLVVVDVSRMRYIDTRTDMDEIVDTCSVNNNNFYILFRDNMISRMHVNGPTTTGDSIESTPVPTAQIDDTIFDTNSLMSTSPVRSILDSFGKVNQLLNTKGLATKVNDTTLATTTAQANTTTASSTDSSATVQQMTNDVTDSETNSLSCDVVSQNDVASAPLSSSLPSSDEHIPPLILERKKKTGKKKRRKTERVIEFDSNDSSGVKTTVSRTKSSRSKKSTQNDESLCSDMLTTNTDMESQLSEADSSTEMSDAINDDLDMSELSSIVDNEQEANSQQAINPVKSENSVEEAANTVVAVQNDTTMEGTTQCTDQQQASKLDEVVVDESNQRSEQEREEQLEQQRRIEAEELRRKQEEEERRRQMEEERRRREEEEQRERERIERLRREKEEEVLCEFKDNVISMLDTMNEAYSEFLLTNENVLWSPDFLPSLHKWAQLVIHSVKQDTIKETHILKSFLSSLPSTTQEQFTTLLNVWFRALVEGKIDRESSTDDHIAVINTNIEILYEYLDLATVFKLCNTHRLLPCLSAILEVEDRSGVMLNERTQIQAMIHRFRQDARGFDDILHMIRSSDQLSLSLRYIPMLLQLDFMKTVHYCASLYPDVQVWNVEAAIDSIIKDKPPMFQYATASKLVLYLRYLISAYEHCTECSTSQPYMLHLFEEMAKFLRHCREQQQQQQQQQEDDAEASYALIPPSYVHDLVVVLLGQAVKGSNVLSTIVPRLEQILLDNSCTDILFILYEATGNDRKLIQSLVHSTHLTQYHETIHSFMENHSSTENWMILLEAANSATTRITIENVVCMMCMIEGSVQSLQILKDCPCESLNTLIYKKICEYASMEAKQNKLKHELLEAVDSYMWSQKDDALSPQIRSLFLMAPPATSAQSDRSLTEKRNIQSLSHLYSSFKLIQTPVRRTTPASLEEELYASGRIDPIRLNLDYNVPLSRYNEDSTSHWGISIKCEQNDQCSVCRLPIRERKGPEITVFQCGHTFHSACLPVGACTTCQEQSFTSILDD